MRNLYVFAALLVTLMGCDSRPTGWSEVVTLEEGKGKAIGSLGLALILGPSGKIQFVLGPLASVFAPRSPETEKDVQLAGASVGSWILEKQNIKISLPRDASGAVKTYGLYENVETDVWQMLSSPGCTTLRATIETSFTGSGTVVEKTYQLCAVEAAINLLKK
jgi:hypothetical protein